jgi:Asp-tRNA(Asn)/Glu-tRNA(Gln) amidotransferase B subunit
MNLTKTGAKNKGENIARAYEYLDKTAYPKLDTDACDAVLLSMMARHTCSILMGFPDEVPEKFLVSLCNSTQETKGKGHNMKIITKGLLHRKEYFYSYTRKDYTLVVNDASRRTNKLERKVYSI